MASREKTITGIEQGRARYAYEKVEEAKDVLKGKAKEYKSYVKKIPMLIKTNGLGATFAFVLSKGKRNDKTPYGLIARQTGEWIQEHRGYLLGDVNKDAYFEGQLTQLSSAQYRAVTIEVLALFNWLKRFADGLIEGNAEEN